MARTAMVSDAQQAAIDFRQQWVARFLMRGLAHREVQAQIAGMTVTDPATGARVPVCVNPETGAPWGLTTIHEDTKYLRDGWKEAADREVEERRAELLACVREMRRLAFASNDLKAVSNAIKHERDLFGLDAPKTSTVAVTGLEKMATNDDDLMADMVNEVADEREASKEHHTNDGPIAQPAASTG